MKKFMLFACMLFASVAAAQMTNPRTATITFSPVTTYTDGSVIPVTVSVSYRIYQGVRGSAKTLVATITAPTTTISTGLQPGVEYCFQASAAAGGVESALTNEGCKLMPPLTPSSFTIIVSDLFNRLLKYLS